MYLSICWQVLGIPTGICAVRSAISHKRYKDYDQMTLGITVDRHQSGWAWTGVSYCTVVALDEVVGYSGFPVLPTPLSLLPAPDHVCRSCPSPVILTKQSTGFWPMAVADSPQPTGRKVGCGRFPIFALRPTVRVPVRKRVCVDPSQTIHPRILTSQGDPTGSSVSS